MDTKRIGNSTELNCITYLYDRGCEILLPYGDSQKYDIVIDYKGELYKIQCKSANPSYKEGGTIDYITFKTFWVSGREYQQKVVYSKEDIDFFATYFDNVCYLIPVGRVASRLKTIRFSTPKNGQTKGITFAKDCIADIILKNL